jgi:hypothetical protein
MTDPTPTSGHLQQSLSQLHSELASTARVDDASRQLLRDVLVDIERLLQAGNAAKRPGEVASAPAALPQSRLEALAVEFEADHPSLAASLREFVNLLARAGL